MTKEELAAKLNGIQYPCRIGKDLQDIAAYHGLVIIYGASDDLLEFEGAFNDELGAWNGVIGLVDSNGILDRERCESDEEIAEYVQRKKKAIQVSAEWCNRSGYSWFISTSIPYAPFDVLEGEDKFCRGIVISVADLPKVEPS